MDNQTTLSAESSRVAVGSMDLVGVQTVESEECETCGGYGHYRIKKWGGGTEDVFCEDCDGKGGFPINTPTTNYTQPPSE